MRIVVRQCALAVGGIVYKLIGVGFCALLVLDRMGMPEPQSVERVTGKTLHAFFVYSLYNTNKK